MKNRKLKNGPGAAGAIVFAMSMFVSLASFAASEPAFADFFGEVKSGALLLRTSEREITPAPSLDTDVHMTVTGIIARVKVTQKFQNPGDTWAEGVYVFPLPDDAAVDHMRLYVDGRVIEGQIFERKEAEQKYEKAKKEGKRASLVHQERPNVFTTYVANISPGGEVSVEIEYQQTVNIDDGNYSLRFPMVLGVRYIPGKPVERKSVGLGWSRDTDVVPDASRVTPPVADPDEGPINPVRISLDISPGFPVSRIESAYHHIEVENRSRETWHITLSEKSVPADRDFLVVWRPKPSKAPSMTVFKERVGEDYYYAVMVTPPHEKFRREKPEPREAVFIFDRSGSMSGTSIKQAKAAFKMAVARLNTNDTFNVIAFNDRTSPLFRRPEPASARNVLMASMFIDEIIANGGTQMWPAVKLVLDRGPAEDKRLRQVIFMTDGDVGNEQQMFELIKSKIGNARLFPIGIGSAPNAYFMRKAARFGRGAFTYIGKVDEVEEKMNSLFKKLESPALTDIEIGTPENINTEFAPSRIPDLYHGKPLTVAFKADAEVDSVNVSGRAGGETWRVTVSLNEAKDGPGIGTLWARRKIGSITDMMAGRINEAERADLRRGIIKLALDHHLVSKYTSLVAVDVTPARPEGEESKTHAMKVNLPKGWNHTKVFGMAQTATGAPRDILIGAVLLLMSLAVWMTNRRRAEQ